MLNIDSGLYFCPSHWLSSTLRIAVVGCGATGSAVAPLLFKLNHIRRELTAQEYGLKLYLFDPKAVTETGKNRTGYFATEVGMNKAIVMANKLNTAYGRNFAVGHPRVFTSVDATNNYDVIITATDSAKSRYDIQYNVSQVSQRKTRLWLDIGVGEQFGNVVLGEFGHGKHRLPNADMVLLGTGERLAHPPADIRKAFREARVGLEVLDTATACRTYNLLAGEGRKVGAALIAV